MFLIFLVIWQFFENIYAKYFEKMWKIYYFVPKELPTKSYPQIMQNAAKKRPAKMGREAPHFVDEAVLLHFALFWGNSW